MEGEFIAVVFKTDEGEKIEIVLPHGAVYDDDDGTTVITLDWKQVGIQHAAYLNHLREQSREQQQATPPEYNENENE